MDFFLLKPAELLRAKPSSSDRDDSLADLLLMDCTLFSKKDLNSMGANSGWTLAGTHNNLEGSASSSPPEGAMEGMAMRDMAEKGNMSGSLLFPTSIDILLRA
jgi:hypothetical protein